MSKNMADKLESVMWIEQKNAGGVKTIVISPDSCILNVIIAMSFLFLRPVALLAIEALASR